MLALVRDYSRVFWRGCEMDAGYETGVLKAADVYRAFAVIQSIMPGMGLEAWQIMTATEVSRHDWLTVIDTKGYLRGLCYVFVRDHPPSARQLEVPVCASISLFNEQDIAKRLFEVIKQRAAETGCEKIHFWRVVARDWKSLEALREAEPRNDGLVYDLNTDLNDALQSILPVKM